MIVVKGLFIAYVIIKLLLERLISYAIIDRMAKSSMDSLCFVLFKVDQVVHARSRRF